MYIIYIFILKFRIAKIYFLIFLPLTCIWGGEGYDKAGGLENTHEGSEVKWEKKIRESLERQSRSDFSKSRSDFYAIWNGRTEFCVQPICHSRILFCDELTLPNRPALALGWSEMRPKWNEKKLNSRVPN